MASVVSRIATANEFRACQAIRFQLVAKVLDITVQETATMYVFQPVNDPQHSQKLSETLVKKTKQMIGDASHGSSKDSLKHV